MLSLLLSDFTLAMSLPAIFAFHATRSKHPCLAFAYISEICRFVSIDSLVAMTYDRQWSLFHRAKKWSNVHFLPANFVVFLIWLSGCLVPISPLLGFGRYRSTGSLPICSLDIVRTVQSKIVVIQWSITGVLFPLIFLGYISWRIISWHHAHKRYVTSSRSKQSQAIVARTTSIQFSQSAVSEATELPSIPSLTSSGSRTTMPTTADEIRRDPNIVIQGSHRLIKNLVEKSKLNDTVGLEKEEGAQRTTVVSFNSPDDQANRRRSVIPYPSMYIPVRRRQSIMLVMALVCTWIATQLPYMAMLIISQFAPEHLITPWMLASSLVLSMFRIMCDPFICYKLDSSINSAVRRFVFCFKNGAQLNANAKYFIGRNEGGSQCGSYVSTGSFRSLEGSRISKNSFVIDRQK